MSIVAFTNGSEPPSISLPVLRRTTGAEASAETAGDRLAEARGALPDIAKRRALHRAAATRLSHHARTIKGAARITPLQRRIVTAGAGTLATLLFVAALTPGTGWQWAMVAGLGLAIHLAGMAAHGGKRLRQAPALGHTRILAVLGAWAAALMALAQALLIAVLPIALGAPFPVALALALSAFVVAFIAYVGHPRDCKAELLERECAEAKASLVRAESEAATALALARTLFEAELAELQNRMAAGGSRRDSAGLPREADIGSAKPSADRHTPFRHQALQALRARLAALIA